MHDWRQEYWNSNTHPPNACRCCQFVVKIPWEEKMAEKYRSRFRRNEEEERRIQDLRRSNASGPTPLKNMYRRKEKYGLEWEDDTDDENNPFLWR